FSFSGTQLIVTPAASVVGSFRVQVTLGDGQVSLRQSFTVTVTDMVPVLDAVPDQTLVHGKSLIVHLTASDPDGDLLTWGAHTVLPSQPALNLQQSLGLRF